MYGHLEKQQEPGSELGVDECFSPVGRKRRSRLWVALFTTLLGLLLFVMKISVNGGANEATLASWQVLLRRSVVSPVQPRAAAAAAGAARKPMVGDSWNYLLSQKATSDSAAKGIKFISIDLFDNDKNTISALKSQGTFVACYFSAGTYENWRPDKAQFPKKALGKPLADWPGERWVNTNSNKVRQIMQSRMDLAVSKGCDGLDPDNIDAYGNKNGLGLKKKDAINYMTFLAKAARSRKLLIGLKNGGDIIPKIITQMDYSINEQCSLYNECDVYQPFIQAGKPVFHVEYPKGDSTNNNQSVQDTAKYCKDPQAAGFSTILKNMNLDAWVQDC